MQNNVLISLTWYKYSMQINFYTLRASLLSPSQWPKKKMNLIVLAKQPAALPSLILEKLRILVHIFFHQFKPLQTELLVCAGRDIKYIIESLRKCGQIDLKHNRYKKKLTFASYLGSHAYTSLARVDRDHIAIIVVYCC